MTLLVETGKRNSRRGTGPPTTRRVTSPPLPHCPSTYSVVVGRCSLSNLCDGRERWLGTLEVQRLQSQNRANSRFLPYPQATARAAPRTRVLIMSATVRNLEDLILRNAENWSPESSFASICPTMEYGNVRMVDPSSASYSTHHVLRPPVGASTTFFGWRQTAK